MITGDHKITAQAVAEELGILRSGGPVAVTGRELEAMSDDMLSPRSLTTSAYTPGSRRSTKCVSSRRFAHRGMLWR